MDKTAILQEISAIESKLLEVSQRVKHAERFDSIDSWIQYILEDDHELARHFVIPTSPRIRQPLLDLITINSPLNKPIVKLLSTRIASYVAVIDDLKVHPMIGPVVNIITDNFQPLVKLVRNYDIYFEQKKTIKLIHQALEANRLHVYESFPKEPSIRIVLKTLQLDTSRDDGESVQALLGFLFEQLKWNLRQPGSISQPRHAWWALLDLLEESEPEWLTEHRDILNETLTGFLAATEYQPREQEPTSVVPEMNSIYNEKVWVTVNMLRVYRANIHGLFPPATIGNLVSKIELNMRELIYEQYDDSIRSNQCRLLVLYEAIAYLNYVDAQRLCNEEEVDLRGRYVGQYLYNDDVVSRFRDVKATINNLIADRRNWTRHILSSLLVSGPPASGKSELMRQIVAEIRQTAEANRKDFHEEFFTVGKRISAPEDLKAVLEARPLPSGSEGVRVLAFDEFDKADFKFTAPFLEVLAAETKPDEPVTFWIFGQSSYPTFGIFESYASSLEDRTLRDFLTRFKLGKIDLAELRVSPQQRILTALGYALRKCPQLESVSRDCIRYFAVNEELLDNRTLIAGFDRSTSLKDNRLSLAAGVKFQGQRSEAGKDGWVRIIR